MSHWTSDDKYINHPSAPTGNFGHHQSLADGCFEEVLVSRPRCTIVLEGDLLDVSLETLFLLPVQYEKGCVQQ